MPMPRLRPGAHLRVIAPSRSLSILSEATIREARARLEGLGFRVSFGARARESGFLDCAAVAARLEDLHQAFLDPEVDGILTAIGGYNSNQLLGGIDYGLIAAHPKPFCGFSDITALHGALRARAGMITWHGPHFSSFAMRRGLGYTVEAFLAGLVRGGPWAYAPSPDWSDDPWYMDQEKRLFEPNPGPWILNPGEAEGRLEGGNLCTLGLLQGTPYMPDLDGAILLIEDDDENGPGTPREVDRNLQSLLHLPSPAGPRALLIGRFQRRCGVTREILARMVAGKPRLASIPVVANLDFGHTTPQITWPMGGLARVRASGGGLEWTMPGD